LKRTPFIQGEISRVGMVFFSCPQFSTFLFLDHGDVFRKSVRGIDFEFNLMEEEGEWYYKIKAENLLFVMRIDEIGMWKIFNPVPCMD
jgi:hypothetical protein